MPSTQPSDRRDLSSAGHALGQFVGDWWEQNVVYPTLLTVAKRMDLFLDNRIVSRTCRTGKIQWKDSDQNFVDYDFVLELAGTNSAYGSPVAFIESFWRRGARHSKDKARDDTNKLLPMRETYPTARFLAIAACGEFTEPARQYVTSRSVELLYITKPYIIEAFKNVGITIDYPDSLSEEGKKELAYELDGLATEENKLAAAEALFASAGKATFASFAKKIEAALGALPAEIRFIRSSHSDPACFSSVEAAEEFLHDPKFSYSSESTAFVYEITYSDGYEFRRDNLTWEALTQLHHDLLMLVKHVEAING